MHVQVAHKTVYIIPQLLVVHLLTLPPTEQLLSHHLSLYQPSSVSPPSTLADQNCKGGDSKIIIKSRGGREEGEEKERGRGREGKRKGKRGVCDSPFTSFKLVSHILQ